MSSLLALDVDDRAIGDFLVGLPVQASSAQAETTAILRGRPDISTRLTLVKVSGRRESRKQARQLGLRRANNGASIFKMTDLSVGAGLVLDDQAL
jgi:hypothetical protein